MLLNKRLSSFLDFVRWFSAFLVVIGHLRALVFVDYNASESKNIFSTVFYFITGLGHQAVMLFFVLSGLLVGGDVVNKIREKRFNFRLYFINRSSRLYAVFPLALIVGYVLDYSGYTFFDQVGLYTKKLALPYIVTCDISKNLNLSIFLSNLFMLQNIYSPPLGSNFPLWSLASEFWYYLLFPLTLMLFTVKKKSVKAAVFLALSLILCMTYKLIPGFIIWLMGVFLWVLKKPLFKNSLVPCAIFLIVLTATRIHFFRFLNDDVVNMLFGVTFMLLLNNVWYSKDKEPIFSGFNRIMSGFSYSLYLLHLPFIFFCLVILNKYMNIGIMMQPSCISFTIFACLLAIVYAYSYLVASITERNTNKFREFLIGFGKRINWIKI